MQRVELGVHTPVHRPLAASQTLVHMVAAPYSPSAPQCFDDTWPMTQVSVPGTHSPAHLPVAGLQVNGHGPV